MTELACDAVELIREHELDGFFLQYSLAFELTASLALPHNGVPKVWRLGLLRGSVATKREQLRLRANVDRRFVDGKSRRDALLKIVLMHQLEVVSGLHYRYDSLL